jgi:histidinol phosphatase-like enzyme
MILRAAHEHGLRLDHSYLIGDKETDISAGRTANLAGTVLIAGDPSTAAVSASEADAVVGDFHAAVQWILGSVSEAQDRNR